MDQRVDEGTPGPNLTKNFKSSQAVSINERRMVQSVISQ